MMRRKVTVIAATWVTLVMLYAAPSTLPEAWQYRIYSPASALLWMLAMIIGPGVACSIKREWIRDGAARR